MSLFIKLINDIDNKLYLIFLIKFLIFNFVFEGELIKLLYGIDVKIMLEEMLRFVINLLYISKYKI